MTVDETGVDELAVAKPVHAEIVRRSLHDKVQSR